MRNVQVMPLPLDKREQKRRQNGNSKGRKNLNCANERGKKARQNEKGIILIASLAKLLYIWWGRFELSLTTNQRQRVNKAAIVIQRSLWKAFRRKSCMDVAKFLSKIKARNGGWCLRVGFRIHRKRIATRKIKAFLTECGSKTHFARYISRYLADIKKVQRYIRGYLLCKRTRFQLLRKIWCDVALDFMNDQDNRTIKAMQPIISKAQISGTSKAILKKLNVSINEWQDTNNCLTEILLKNYQGPTSRIGKGRSKAKKPRQLSSATRDAVILDAMLSARRRYDQSMSTHVKRRKKMEYLGSSNKNLYSSFNVDDVIRILNIHEANVGVKYQTICFDDDNYRTSSSHPFLFWTVFADGCSVRTRVLKLYAEAYQIPNLFQK